MKILFINDWGYWLRNYGLLKGIWERIRFRIVYWLNASENEEIYDSDYFMCERVEPGEWIKIDKFRNANKI